MNWQGNTLVLSTLILATGMSCSSAEHELSVREIEREIDCAVYGCDQLQKSLSDRALLTEYSSLCIDRGGTNVWTRALQKALEEHAVVCIPASDDVYYVDATLVIPSNRRIEAEGATVRLMDGVATVLLRNANTPDGTLAPIQPGRRDDNIAIVGGRWEDNCTSRAGYGMSGRYDMGSRKVGRHYGVSALFYFGNVNHLTIRDATFFHCGGFAVQIGDADSICLERIRFDRCFADGLHMNGNVSRVKVREVCGQVGDDLVALNAYDWLDSSVNFGPQRYILCEDLELVRHPDVPTYPALRILPAKYRYADGTVVDCAISDVIFRRVKGITTYKMYMQTPGYAIGSEPEWGEVGSGGNLFFFDLEIDLDAPIDNVGQYATQEAPRGHFAAFEFGANLSLVHFKNVDITFHADKWPLTHLIQVGPKSCFIPDKDGKLGMKEIFDPYLSCHVGKVVLENVRTHGVVPKKLVYASSFDNVNRDGRSTGRGIIDKIERINERTSVETNNARAKGHSAL